MCDYPFFIPQVVLFANSSLFWFKVTNEHREFRNYLYLFIVFKIKKTDMIQHHISTKNKPPPQAELIPSVSHPNQNSSVKKASLLTPVLPTYHLPGSLQ